MNRRVVIGIALVLAAACVPAPSSSSVPSSPSLSQSAQPSPTPQTFVVPVPTEQPITRDFLANASYANPDIQRELRSLFQLFYNARTLPRGGQFDVAALPGLVEGSYADYTLPLFEQEVSDAQAGRLLEVRFSAVAVSVLEWTGWGADGRAGAAKVSVTRTRTELRAGSSPTAETATYKFAAERWGQRSELYGGIVSTNAGPDAVHWSVYDFVNPATDRWISQPPPFTAGQASTELAAWFADFYAARSVEPGRPFDINPSLWRVNGSYAAYTKPLLVETAQQVASGAIKEIRYTGISVKLITWDENATSHGGLALVEVTRTAHVTNASGPEPAQTATYQFRVHRHVGATWFAVDFLRPDVGRWVTEIAGATVIVPESGHG